MKTASIHYAGNLRTEALHLRSGDTIITDAPVDNHGKGEAFSPTDLVAAACASCILTVMGIAADKAGFALGGVRAEVQKTMLKEPRRIGELEVSLSFEDNYTEAEKTVLEEAARSNPVINSLNPELNLMVSFDYGGEEQDKN